MHLGGAKGYQFGFGFDDCYGRCSGEGCNSLGGRFDVPICCGIRDYVTWNPKLNE